MITYRQSNISKDKTLSNLTLFCIQYNHFPFSTENSLGTEIRKIELRKTWGDLLDMLRKLYCHNGSYRKFYGIFAPPNGYFTENSR